MTETSLVKTTAGTWLVTIGSGETLTISYGEKKNFYLSKSSRARMSLPTETIPHLVFVLSQIAKSHGIRPIHHSPKPCPDCGLWKLANSKRCNDCQEKRDQQKQTHRDKQQERRIACLKMRLDNKTFREIGEFAGVGPTRALQIVARAARDIIYKRRFSDDPLRRTVFHWYWNDEREYEPWADGDEND